MMDAPREASVPIRGVTSDPATAATRIDDQGETDYFCSTHDGNFLQAEPAAADANRGDSWTTEDEGGNQIIEGITDDG